MIGREVMTLVNSLLFAGVHSTEFSGTRLAGGIYLYRLDALPIGGTEAITSIKKMIFIK